MCLADQNNKNAGREWQRVEHELLHCGSRVVHAFPLPETDRRTICHLENWIFTSLNNTECMTGQDMSPSDKHRQKPACWKMEKCWRTWASQRVDWQRWQRWCQKWPLQKSRTPKMLGNFQTGEISPWTNKQKQQRNLFFSVPPCSIIAYSIFFSIMHNSSHCQL